MVYSLDNFESTHGHERGLEFSNCPSHHQSTCWPLSVNVLAIISQCVGHHQSMCWPSVNVLAIISQCVGHHQSMCWPSSVNVLAINSQCVGHHQSMCWPSIVNALAINSQCVGHHQSMCWPHLGNNHRKDVGCELPVVPLPHTVEHSRAVVIKTAHTLVAELRRQVDNMRAVPVRAMHKESVRVLVIESARTPNTMTMYR